MNNEINYTKMLEKAGFTREQSETQINIIGMIMNQDFAKRSDIFDLKNEIGKLSIRIDKLEGKFNNLEGKFDNLEGKFDNLSGRLDNLSGNLIKHLYIAIGVATGVLGIWLSP